MRPIRTLDPSPPADWDLLAGYGWCSDTPDPGGFLSSLLLGPDLGGYEAKLSAADRLRAGARLKAFGKLDLEIVKNVAPGAAMHTYNNRYFFSGRVDPRSLTYHSVYQDWSIPALALK